MTRRPLILLICLIVLTGSLPGCGDDGAAPPRDTTPVMSLDVGTTWDYLVQSNEPGAPLVPMRRTIAEHREIEHDGRAITVAVEMSVDAEGAVIGLSSGRLLRNEEDGVYVYGWVIEGETTLFTNPQLLAPRDGHPGLTLDMGGGTFMVCVAADSLITTSDSGEFTADVYEYWLDQGTIRVPGVYVVPGVGLTLYYHPQWTMWMVGYYDFQ